MYGIFRGLFLVGLVLLLVWMVWHVNREMGASPSTDILASYSPLPYFDERRAIFKGMDVMTDHSHHVARTTSDQHTQKFGFGKMFRMLFFSPNAPKTSYNVKQLTRTSFIDSQQHAVYWLGHSSAIIELAGKRLAVDPVLGDASPIPGMVRRYHAAPIRRTELPRLDYVLITHNHYDHLERSTVLAIDRAVFIVPMGVGAALQGWGIDRSRIVELAWQQSYADAWVSITAEEAQHFSGRRLGDRNRTAWNSYIIEADDKRIFWGCDGGYGAHFKRIGEYYGPFDWAALEIDAWNDNWSHIHMRPEEVVMACSDLRVNAIMPIHWGVFDLAWHPFTESIERLIAVAQSHEVTVFAPMMGERWLPSQQPLLSEYWWR